MHPVYPEEIEVASGTNNNFTQLCQSINQWSSPSLTQVHAATKRSRFRCLSIQFTDHVVYVVISAYKRKHRMCLVGVYRNLRPTGTWHALDVL